MADSALTTNPAAAPVLGALTAPRGDARFFVSDQEESEGIGRSKRIDLDVLLGNRRMSAANTPALGATLFSVTGSASTPVIDLTGTWNTTGAPVGISFSVTDIASDALSKLKQFRRIGASQNPAILSLGIAGGTVASPTIVTSGKILARLAFEGFDGSNWLIGASIIATATGTMGATRMGSSLTLRTATDAAPSVLTDRLTIDSNGLATFSSRGAALFNGVSGGFPGIYVKITSDTLSRVGFELDMNNFGRVLWGSGNANPDIYLYRDAAGYLALRNGTSHHNLRIYETESSSLTNFSRVALITEQAVTSGTLMIRSQAAGTGLTAGKPRILQVGTGSSSGTDIAGQDTIIHGGISTGTGLRGAILFQQSAPGGSGSSANALSTMWSISSAGHLLPGTDNVYDIGAISSPRLRSIYCAGTIASTGQIETSSNVKIGAGLSLFWNGRSTISSPADGVIVLASNAGADFGRFQFGGTTSSFPALKRSSAQLHCRLADDSADAVFQALQLNVASTKVVGAQGAAVADASGGAVIDAEARTALNALLARVRTHGLIAT